jgi:hypothetical protein
LIRSGANPARLGASSICLLLANVESFARS